MLPLVPKSVKMEPEISTRLKDTASLIGYSENQLIVESVKATLDVADDENNPVPRLVALIRSARNHQKAPPRFGEASLQPSARKRINWWWAT
jgi:hypothetical protein